MGSTLSLDAQFISHLLEALAATGRRLIIPLGRLGTLEPDLSRIEIGSGVVSINFHYRYRRAPARPLKVTAKFALEELDGGVIWLRIRQFGPLKGKILKRGSKLWEAAHERKGSVRLKDGLIGLPLALIYAAWPIDDPPEIVGIKITDRLVIQIA